MTTETLDCTPETKRNAKRKLTNMIGSLLGITIAIMGSWTCWPTSGAGVFVKITTVIFYLIIAFVLYSAKVHMGASRFSKHDAIKMGDLRYWRKINFAEQKFLQMSIVLAASATIMIVFLIFEIVKIVFS